MAKPKISMKELQRKYEQRLKNQRRNDGNWTCKITCGTTPKDIADFNDLYYENTRAKTKKKNVKKY